MTLYDKTGSAIAYVADDYYIYLFNGQAVAYLSDDAVYSFTGKYWGWFEDGWIRDVLGYCAFFTEQAVFGPTKPVKKAVPTKGIKKAKPAKKSKETPKIKSIKFLAWSSLSGKQFFGP